LGFCCVCFFFFQAEDGIRDAQESRGLGDVYKRQPRRWPRPPAADSAGRSRCSPRSAPANSPSAGATTTWTCLLYTSDAADEEDSVDLGGRRIIKKKKKIKK